MLWKKWSPAGLRYLGSAVALLHFSSHWLPGDREFRALFGRIQFLAMLAKFQPSGGQKISSIWWLVNIIWNTDPSVHFILVVYVLVGQVFRNDLIFGQVGQIVATWWRKKGIFGVFQQLSGILITQPLHMWYMHWLCESSECSSIFGHGEITAICWPKNGHPLIHYPF